MVQDLIEACCTGDFFICPGCGKLKKYYATGLCKGCYLKNCYYTNEKFRNLMLKRSKLQTLSGYRHERYLADRIGNMDNIERLCLEHGFSKSVSKAIAMDGVILDKKMKDKGIV